MANPFSKGWKYLMSSLDSKIDENADPKVQIEQAADAARKQHQQVSEQAASIIGNKKQLEMKLDRLVKSQEDLQDKTRQALNAADQAAQEGNSQKSQEFNSTAEVFASQLVAVEQQIEESKQLHAQSSQAADQAQQQQKESEARLKEQLGQIDQLKAQADQAKMQESSAKAMDSMNSLKPDDSVPTLDGVRDKIEKRYSDALGAQELTQDSVGDRMAEIQSSGNDMKASARLSEIRAQMSGGSELNAGNGRDAAGEITEGTGDAATQDHPEENPAAGDTASGTQRGENGTAADSPDEQQDPERNQQQK